MAAPQAAPVDRQNVLLLAATQEAGLTCYLTCIHRIARPTAKQALARGMKQLVRVCVRTEPRTRIKVIDSSKNQRDCCC